MHPPTLRSSGLVFPSRYVVPELLAITNPRPGQIDSHLFWIARGLFNIGLVYYDLHSHGWFGPVTVVTETSPMADLFTGQEPYKLDQRAVIHLESVTPYAQAPYIKGTVVRDKSTDRWYYVDANGQYVPEPVADPQGLTAIPVGPSPFVYVNPDPATRVIYILGGSVSAIKKDGTTLFASTDKTVVLGPGQSLEVVYSAAPVMYKD